MQLVKFINEKEVWEKFLKNLPEENFLQSWNWGEFQKSLGKKIFRLGFYQEQQLEGIALLVKETAKRGEYLTCAGGPLLDWQRSRLVDNFVETIKEIAEAERVWFIRIRPQLLKTSENRSLFTSYDFINAPMHMHAENTWQLKLAAEKKQLLAQMQKDHRYELRKAERCKIRTVISKETKDIEFLYKLQNLTARRQKFIPFSKQFLKNQFSIFAKNNQAIIVKALEKNKPIAIAMILFYGKEAVYHYAAATERARQTAAAYAICWRAILEAKKRNLERFNFWGLAPKGKKTHRFVGLNHFKKGFGGFAVNYLHAQDLPMSSFYWLTHIFEQIRKLRRKL